jgi:hypothetical protein
MGMLPTVLRLVVGVCGSRVYGLVEGVVKQWQHPLIQGVIVVEGALVGSWRIRLSRVLMLDRGDCCYMRDHT